MKKRFVSARIFIAGPLFLHSIMWRNWIRRGHQAFDALAQLPQPVSRPVARPGLWRWSGTGCYHRYPYCSAEAQMALPETGLATVPGWSGTQRLTALLGRSLVKELVFTGEPLDAQRALSCGLVKSRCRQGGVTRRRTATGTTYRPACSRCSADRQAGY